ncbi:MAG: chitobiase/beta-hexosaminidase C-terminal domain-containing protein [Oscillospiraceae bacterium]|nr:chitobiase/beta-hexosaminidase C-terminal domain-containing protein [Oscillospiraceae bacterium]
MNKKRTAALLAALVMTAGSVPAFAEDTADIIPADSVEEIADISEDAVIEETEEAAPEEDAAAEVVSAESASEDTAEALPYELIEDSADFEADALPAKPTITVKTAFGGKTISFACADTDAEIYYNFGSSAITTSSKHAKPGEVVFIDEPMATGIYFKSYKNGKWSREVGKWGFNNVRIAKPIITQSGPASDNKFKLYTQTSNSYMVYTLDGSTPEIEEGTQTLKVKNGRIVWGTSTVLEVPAGRTINAIAVRCGLVTSEVMTFTNPNKATPVKKEVPALPKIADAGFNLHLIDPPTTLLDLPVRQAGGKYCSDPKAAQDRMDMYASACKALGFEVYKHAPITNSSGTSTIYYLLYFNEEPAAAFIGTYGIDPTYQKGDQYKTIVYVLDASSLND